MIIPSKEEILDGNILVQGARLIRVLESGALTIDDIRSKYATKRQPRTPSMERTLDVLTYLHIIGLVVTDGPYIALAREK